jgi:hypothetical protein
MTIRKPFTAELIRTLLLNQNIQLSSFCNFSFSARRPVLAISNLPLRTLETHHFFERRRGRLTKASSLHPPPPPRYSLAFRYYLFGEIERDGPRLERPSSPPQ